MPPPAEANEITLQHFNAGRLGSVFGGVPEVGVTIEALLKRDAKL